VLQREVRLF